MKRVYAKVAARPIDGGHGVELDGRPVRTPARRPLVVPSAALARAVATEWDAQRDTVDPRAMPMMRLASSAIDVVTDRRAEIVDQIAGYGATDLVCYRADRPPELVARQQAAWQPLVDWALVVFDAPLVVTSGVVPVAQPEGALKALRRTIEARDAWRLAALASAAHAAGSVIVALALVERRLAPEDAWHASQIDESFEIEQWGEDAEANLRRIALRDDLIQARRFLDLLGS